MELIIFFTDPQKLRRLGNAVGWNLKVNPVLERRITTELIIWQIYDKLKLKDLKGYLENERNLTKVYIVHHDLPRKNFRDELSRYFKNRDVELWQHETHHSYNSNRGIYKELQRIHLFTRNDFRLFKDIILDVKSLPRKIHSMFSSNKDKVIAKKIELDTIPEPFRKITVEHLQKFTSENFEVRLEELKNILFDFLNNKYLADD